MAVGLTHATPIARRVAPVGAYNIIVLSEGFTAAQKLEFVDATNKLREQVLRETPFGLCRTLTHTIGFWRFFKPSNVSGPAVGTTPEDTVFGSTYDPATNRLAIDEAALTRVIGEIDLVGPNGQQVEAATLLRRPYRPNAGLVVILLPGTAASGPVTADLDVVDPSNLSYLASTLGPGWERVALKAIGRGLGLGDESSDQATPPSDVDLSNLEAFPNLVTAIPASGLPDAGFKWFSQLDTYAQTQPLTVVPHGSKSPKPDEPIQLFEGGGGFQAKVYRSASDCLMSRTIGTTGRNSPRADGVGFCRICRAYLSRALAGTESILPLTTIDKQALEFDAVPAKNWLAVSRTTSGFPLARSVTSRTTAPGPWWSFNASIDPDQGGLRLENIMFRDHGGPMAGEKVAEAIEFRDIVVEFDDGKRIPFDVRSAFLSTSDPPVLIEATDGSADATDIHYLHGIKLTLNHDFGGRAPVQVVMSIVMKGEAADTDPGGNIFAAKLYPQIALRWLPGGTHRVTGFRSCVRLLLNNGLKPGMGASPPATVASFFVDTNDIPGFERRFITYPDIWWTAAAPYIFGTNWANIFDYCLPNLQYETEIDAVYSPGAADVYQGARSATIVWPPGSTYHEKVTKLGHQGAYDNVHIHGSIGPDPEDPNGGPYVHAPGCAEACIHIHWRWGKLGAFPASVSSWRPRQYVGWGPKYGNVWPGLPLTPPNQGVRVAVTRPDTTRADPDQDVVRASGISFDPGDTRKAVWYTVDVNDNVLPDCWHVIFSHGLSYAYRYNLSSWLLKLGIKWARVSNDLPDTMSDEEVLHKIYSYIRWFRDPSGNVQAVPLGTTAAGSGTLETL